MNVLGIGVSPNTWNHEKDQGRRGHDPSEVSRLFPISVQISSCQVNQKERKLTGEECQYPPGWRFMDARYSKGWGYQPTSSLQSVSRYCKGWELCSLKRADPPGWRNRSGRPTSLLPVAGTGQSRQGGITAKECEGNGWIEVGKVEIRSKCRRKKARRGNVGERENPF